MRIGGSILALMVFGAAFLGMPPSIHAQQDQEAAPPVYVTPNTNSSAKPLFLRKLFGTDEPNSGIGAPKPYDFSHRNEPAQQHGFNQEVQDEFYQRLEQHVALIRAKYEQTRQEQMAAAERDRQKSYAFMASLRAQAMAASQATAQRMAVHSSGAGNIKHQGVKKGRGAHAASTHGHAHGQSGEAPPIYVQHQ